MSRSDEYKNAWDAFSKKWRRGDSAKHLGDEWGPTEEITGRFIVPYLRPGMKVLEVGPGGGRYTEKLAGITGRSNVDAADCSPEMLERIKQRLLGVNPILIDGKSLSTIKPKKPYDFVFSYDVFVHIDLYDIATMISQLKSLTAPSAICVIHHSELGTESGLRHWMASRKHNGGDDFPRSFSVNSSTLMYGIIERSGFRVVRQEPVRNGRDVVTVFDGGQNS